MSNQRRLPFEELAEERGAGRGNSETQREWWYRRLESPRGTRSQEAHRTVGPSKTVFHSNSRKHMLSIDVIPPVDTEVQIYEFKPYLGCCIRNPHLYNMCVSDSSHLHGVVLGGFKETDVSGHFRGRKLRNYDLEVERLCAHCTLRTEREGKGVSYHKKKNG